VAAAPPRLAQSPAAKASTFIAYREPAGRLAFFRKRRIPGIGLPKRPGERSSKHSGTRQRSPFRRSISRRISRSVIGLRPNVFHASIPRISPNPSTG
jgi:hypothetical protein